MNCFVGEHPNYIAKDKKTKKRQMVFMKIGKGLVESFLLRV